MANEVKLSDGARKDIRRDAERNCEGATVADTLRLLDDYDALQCQVNELTSQRDAILLQARCWAGEAKAQQAITREVGAILGGIPDWGAIAAGVEELRSQLEAARGLLDEINLLDRSGETEPTKLVHRYNKLMRKVRSFLTATPAPEGRQYESLDERLKEAGMLSVAELLKGAPLDAFIKHAGVHDLATLLQWAEMRRGEYLRMMARYDLGEKDKGDDLYEWTVAHCAVFTELHVNLRAALAEQGERQEAVEVVVPAKLTGATGFAKGIEDGWNAAIDAVIRLNATPQPGPDVRELVSADDVRDACANAVSVFADETNAEQCREVAEYMREVLLAQIAKQQAQGKGE